MSKARSRLGAFGFPKKLGENTPFISIPRHSSGESGFSESKTVRTLQHFWKKKHELAPPAIKHSN
jgi:hypothetical protein